MSMFLTQKLIHCQSEVMLRGNDILTAALAIVQFPSCCSSKWNHVMNIVQLLYLEAVGILAHYIDK